MRLLAPCLLILASLGCSSDPEKDEKGTEGEYASGPLVPMRVVVWDDGEGAGSAHVTERRLNDGGMISREHAVTLDPEAEREPGIWTDVSIETDADGRAARILAQAGLGTEQASDPRTLELRRSDEGRWFRVRPSGKLEPLADLDDIDDIEVSIDHYTPSIAIRRLKLAVGSSKDFDRVLVRIPQMDAEPVRRRLARTAEDRYRWESLDASGNPTSSLDLAVDASGMVTRIDGPGVSRRVVRDVVVK